MTPSKWIGWAMGIVAAILLLLFTNFISYGNGVDEKQDIRIERIEDGKAASDSDVKLLQYRIEQTDKKVDGVARGIEVLDNKIDEVVNRLREEFPSQ